MRISLASSIGIVLLGAVLGASRVQPVEGFAAVLSRAVQYVQAYERAFSVLALEEHYVQEIRPPATPGGIYSQSNPGGGMQARGSKRAVMRSDYLLVQLGYGSGWLPVRDVFEVTGSKTRAREDRLVKLFTEGGANRFETAAKINAESAAFNLGPVTRSINIPMLALMFLHPEFSDRFAFDDGGEEMVGPWLARRVSYKEVSRPTLVKTARGHDMPLNGHVWFDQSTGAVLKTDLFTSDPTVQASVAVTFRKDEGLKMWLPDQMTEYYKAAHNVDEIIATATYSKARLIAPGVDQ